MPILSLGFPMPGPQVSNHSFASAPSFFDYDAIVVNPLAVSQMIEEIVSGSGEHKTRHGEPIVNGSAGPGSVALADLLRDRRDETARLLARGGIVVCIAHPNVQHEGVAGFLACDRYCWLPAPEGMRYDSPFLRRGTGTEIVAPDPEHPFARYASTLRGKLAYHAYFEDTQQASVFARSAGGAAVGVELALDDGRVVFLPPLARDPTSEQRYTISNAIAEGVLQTLRLASASSVPVWVEEYALPGLEERRAARDEARGAAASAQEALASRDEAANEIERYTRLLWQDGKYGLEEPARAALTLLGFRVVAQDIDSPAEVRTEANDPRERVVALLEVDGSVEAVGMDGHYRLRRRLEEAIAAGKPKRGLLIINGHRRLAPPERPQQYEDSLRVAAETMRYCVATGEQLFHGVRAALASDEETVRALRARLLATEGVMGDD